MPAWRRLALLFAASTFCDMAAWGQMTAFTPLYLRVEFGLAPDEVTRWTGLLTAAMLAPALPLSPLWGVMADRWGRKPVILRGVGISVVGYVLTAFAPNVEVLLLARLIFGLGFGVMIGILAAQADITPTANVAGAISLIQMMNPIGQAIGPLYGSVLLDWLGPRGLWIAMALQEIVSFSLVFFLFHETIRRESEPLRRKLAGSLAAVRGSRQLIGVFVVIFLMAAGAGLVDPFVPVYLDQLYTGANAAAFVGVAVSAYWLVTGLLTPVIGRFADRYGRERIFGWALLAIAGVVMLLATVPFQTAEPAWAFAGLNLLRGVPQSATIGLAMTLVILCVAPHQRSSVLALTPFPRQLASFVAPLVGAVLAPFGPGALFTSAAVAFAAAWAMIRWTSPQAAATPLPIVGTVGGLKSARRAEDGD